MSGKRMGGPLLELRHILGARLPISDCGPVNIARSRAAEDSFRRIQRKILLERDEIGHATLSCGCRARFLPICSATPTEAASSLPAAPCRSAVGRTFGQTHRERTETLAASGR